jgi:putative ABC transport system substrate-binding protein
MRKKPVARMRRRDLITFLAGGAVASPFVAIAQVPAVPVIGFLSSQSPDPKLLARFHQGLNELGYFEGQNFKIEYKWAHNQNQTLRALAVELVEHRVALIATTGGMVAAKAAKEVTATIPILFVSGLDPVENGFVARLNRPGGNATGVRQYTRELVPKSLELLKEMVPKAKKFAYLQNEDGTGLGPSEKVQREAETHIARELGLVVYYARNESEIEVAFASIAQQPIEALLVGSDPFFINQRGQIVALAARSALPAAYLRRQFTDAGGLMSYGPSAPETWRQIGLYAGRILKGARPGDLPVMIQSKLELIINLKTAKALGLTVPRLLRALADEVIE